MNSIANRNATGDIYGGTAKNLLTKAKRTSPKKRAKTEPAKDDQRHSPQKSRYTHHCLKDLIRGEISFDTTELGDFVIARARKTIRSTILQSSSTTMQYGYHARHSWRRTHLQHAAANSHSRSAWLSATTLRALPRFTLAPRSL